MSITGSSWWACLLCPLNIGENRNIVLYCFIWKRQKCSHSCQNSFRAFSRPLAFLQRCEHNLKAYGSAISLSLIHIVVQAIGQKFLLFYIRMYVNNTRVYHDFIDAVVKYWHNVENYVWICILEYVLWTTANVRISFMKVFQIFEYLLNYDDLSEFTVHIQPLHLLLHLLWCFDSLPW